MLIKEKKNVVITNYMYQLFLKSLFEIVLKSSQAYQEEIKTKL